MNKKNLIIYLIIFNFFILLIYLIINIKNLELDFNNLKDRNNNNTLPEHTHNPDGNQQNICLSHW